MKKDIAIDEIRAVRHRISERFGHNTKALLDYYREMEKRYKNRILADTSERENKKSEPGQP